MEKRKILSIVTFILFVVYISVAFNWISYENSISFLIFLLALIIIILSIIIIANKENDAATKVAFSFILVSTILPIVIPFIFLFGYWLDRP
ncbi:hypothetical protein [Vagococcus carniphilus]|uniref:Uncharacterized protein n=1 Tax=Vagococcus carniphilus TaxID=218144 RepID=A0AAW8UAH4_9ENTE|nr:hypothetical protein [Vagococcus carniphilus]MDT2813469.1 hypothetical protein [Vagococcus carniphilus]MDT2830079.1 hypothetical protein [Vagococcus carniphilus]MDT2833963.1 hypothetical protein [Vagococcus carniphilus]MDT2838512.1 hypothetical protein [Vagococcus carniphilus]MDT2853349.1 hypothetical protein [Vagococcus carniphilus]